MPLPTAEPVSLLPNLTPIATAQLLVRVDLTQPIASDRTQKATFAQLLTFLVQNMATVQPCLSDPNSETIGAFFGSVALGSDNGTIWQKQSAGYGTSGWVIIYGP